MPLCSLVAVRLQQRLHFLQQKWSISLHPNPTFSVIEVASQKPIQLIEVFDTRGTLVFNTYPGPGANTAQVDLSPYSDGVYMIKVHTSIGIATKQAIKMKSD